MDIKSLTLRNFKGVGDTPQRIEFAPITLLFGPNSAGKSTILHAFLYLNEVLSNGNCSPEFTEFGGDSIDLGGFYSLVHGHDLSKAIEISVEFSFDEFEIPDYLSDYESDELSERGLPYTSEFFQDINLAKVHLEIKWSNHHKKAYISNYSVFLDEGLICFITTKPETFESTINLLQMDAEPFCISMDEETGLPSFNSMLSLMVSYRWSATRDDMAVSERPFANYLVGSMRNLVADDEYYSYSLLLAIKAELSGHRHTQAARLFESEIDALLAEMEESIENKANVADVPLIRTGEGFLNFNRILPIPSEFWDESQEELIPFQLYKRFAESVITSAVIGPAKCLSKWLKEYTYIGPIRQVPPRNYLPSLENKSKSWASGMAAWNQVVDLPEKKIEMINYWMENALETGYELFIRTFHEAEAWDHEDEPGKVQTRKRVMFNRIMGDRLEVLPSDVGVGISQVFPVIVLSCIKEHGLAAIEQPELHIHPKLQVELADLFIDAVRRSHAMFLLETHSEHLLLRFLRRIRENNGNSSKFNKDSLAVIYAESSLKGSEYTNLEITEDGDFVEGWPAGFFDERDEELF